MADSADDKAYKHLHFAKDSLFSTTSGWTDYRGFFNLAILLLIISNGRVALENLIKYGVLATPCNTVDWLWHSTSQYMESLMIVIWSNLTIFLAYFFELLLARHWISNAAGAALYLFVLSMHLTLPVFVVANSMDNPFFLFLSLELILVEALKLISYAHVNYWCRHQSVHSNARFLSATDLRLYPANLTVSNLYYFMVAPTLCYELEFPRTVKRRWPFIFKRVLELVGFTFVIVALCQQWVIPLLKNSLHPFTELDLKRCLERVLKLAIPNLLIWLMLFYLYFHSFLNLLAELLRFADRQFYLDFWNAESISTFWKTWNIPVHRWAVRHIFKPVLRSSGSRFMASSVVFVVSAILHEYLVSVPLKLFRLWACSGMLAQIPLGMVTDRYLKGGRPGNIIVWLSLILGQPMAILMYVHDWYLLNPTQ